MVSKNQVNGSTKEAAGKAQAKPGEVFNSKNQQVKGMVKEV